MSSGPEKQIILIVTPDAERKRRYASWVMNHVMHAVTFHSADGADALKKISNARPQVLVMDYDLPKVSGTKLLDQVFEDPAFNSVAVIITGQLPRREQYVDELVSGRVQFFESTGDETDFKYCLLRSLRFRVENKNTEFVVRSLKKGEILIREGDKADFVFIVKRGQLEAFRLTQGKEVILGLIEVGEFVGEMAYINGEPRTASVRALQDSELVQIPLGTLENVLYSRPAWSKTLLATLSKRLKRANQTRLDD